DDFLALSAIGLQEREQAAIGSEADFLPARVGLGQGDRLEIRRVYKSWPTSVAGASEELAVRAEFDRPSRPLLFERGHIPSRFDVPKPIAVVRVRVAAGG